MALPQEGVDVVLTLNGASPPQVCLCPRPEMFCACLHLRHQNHYCRLEPDATVPLPMPALPLLHKHLCLRYLGYHHSEVAGGLGLGTTVTPHVPELQPLSHSENISHQCSRHVYVSIPRAMIAMYSHALNLGP